MSHLRMLLFDMESFDLVLLDLMLPGEELIVHFARRQNAWACSSSGS